MTAHGPITLPPDDPLVTADTIDEQEFTRLCSAEPKKAREIVRGLALKLSPQALIGLYQRLTKAETAPAEIVKIAGEIFNIAGVRQGPQDALATLPQFQIHINLGQPEATPVGPIIDIKVNQPAQFDELVFRKDDDG